MSESYLIKMSFNIRLINFNFPNPENFILVSDDPVSPENPSFKVDYSTLTGIRATKKGTKLAFYMFALDHKLFFESCLPLTSPHSGYK